MNTCNIINMHICVYSRPPPLQLDSGLIEGVEGSFIIYAWCTQGGL